MAAHGNGQRKRWRLASAVGIAVLAAPLTGCHGHYSYHSGQYGHCGSYGSGYHHGASGDAALVLLAVYGVAAFLLWCFD